MIEITNLDEFCRDLEREIDAAEDAFDRTYSDYAKRLLLVAASTSPQWSGSFAANWRLSFFESDYAYEPVIEDTPYQSTHPLDTVRFRGDPYAVMEALRRNATILKNITVHEDVYLVNNTPYGPEVALNQLAGSGEPFLRPGNYLDPRPYPLGAVVEREGEILVSAKAQHAT